MSGRPPLDPDEIGNDLDSEALLAQGDELLRSSRRLLEDLDGRLDPDEGP